MVRPSRCLPAHVSIAWRVSAVSCRAFDPRVASASGSIFLADHRYLRRCDFTDFCAQRLPGDQPIAGPKAEEASRALAQLRERKGGPCVSTVSIVCDPTGHLQRWARARSTAVVANGICRTSGLLFRVGTGSTIADAADGADGVFGK